MLLLTTIPHKVESYQKENRDNIHAIQERLLLHSAADAGLVPQFEGLPPSGRTGSAKKSKSHGKFALVEESLGFPFGLLAGCAVR